MSRHRDCGVLVHIINKLWILYEPKTISTVAGHWLKPKQCPELKFIHRNLLFAGSAAKLSIIASLHSFDSWCGWWWLDSQGNNHGNLHHYFYYITPERITAEQTIHTLQELYIEKALRYPPYSPDLSPVVYIFFPQFRLLFIRKAI